MREEVQTSTFGGVSPKEATPAVGSLDDANTPNAEAIADAKAGVAAEDDAALATNAGSADAADATDGVGGETTRLQVDATEEFDAAADEAHHAKHKVSSEDEDMLADAWCKAVEEAATSPASSS